MKKIIVFIVLLFSAAGFKAQTSGLSIGLEGGPGLCFLRYDHRVFGPKVSQKIGYCSAVFIQYDFKKIFSLRTAAYLDFKGVNYKYADGPLANVDCSATFKYITVPVLLRAGFGKKIKFFVNAGPYVSFLLSEKDNQERKYERSIVNVTTIDNTNSFKNDVGVSFGIGASYPVRNFVFSIEARSNTGLVDIDRDPLNPLYIGSNIKTNSTNLLLGIAYKFQKKTKSTDAAKTN